MPALCPLVFPLYSRGLHLVIYVSCFLQRKITLFISIAFNSSHSHSDGVQQRKDLVCNKETKHVKTLHNNGPFSLTFYIFSKLATDTTGSVFSELNETSEKRSNALDEILTKMCLRCHFYTNTFIYSFERPFEGIFWLGTMAWGNIRPSDHVLSLNTIKCSVKVLNSSWQDTIYGKRCIITREWAYQNW